MAWGRILDLLILSMHKSTASANAPSMSGGKMKVGEEAYRQVLLNRSESVSDGLADGAGCVLFEIVFNPIRNWLMFTVEN